MAGNPSPLLRQIETIQFTDVEIRRILNRAADDVRFTNNTIRRAQKSMALASTQLWAGVEGAIKAGMGDAVYSATEFQALFDERLFAATGIPSSYWSSSLLATSQEGAQSLISRRDNGYTLSQRVWRNSQATQKALNETIDAGLVLGKSAAEIASDVKQFLRPNVPGGASYAAMRLGRTEVNNAYHATSMRHYRETPWIDEVKWWLSGSHPKPDECNEYAEAVNGRGMGAGVWKVSDVPDKPHPQCLCYVTPVSPDLDKFAKDYKSGKYDQYVEQQMGCSRVA